MAEDIRNQFQKKVLPRLGEKKGPSPLVPAIAKRPRIDESTSSGSKIASTSLPAPPFNSDDSGSITKVHAREQKLIDKAARIMTDVSKLKMGISEFLEDAQQSKDLKEFMTPELLLALHMLRVQSEVCNSVRLCLFLLCVSTS